MKDVIIQGDTLETLRTLESDSVDMGVTSPPYNKRNVGGGIFRAIEYDKVSDNLPEDVYQQNQIDVLNELYRIIIPGGSFFYNHKVRHLKGIATFPLEWLMKADWHIRQEIIWVRTTCTEWGGYRFHPKDERIYWLYKPVDNNVIGTRIESKHAVCSSVWGMMPDLDNPHPAPFPVLLPLRCILSIMDGKKGLVIDPYLGSGSTAIASKLLGCCYVGIEISENYIEHARKRISEYKSYKYILDDELKTHIIKNSYKDRQKKKKKANIDVFFDEERR